MPHTNRQQRAEDHRVKNLSGGLREYGETCNRSYWQGRHQAFEGKGGYGRGGREREQSPHGIRGRSKRGMGGNVGKETQVRRKTKQSSKNQIRSLRRLLNKPGLTEEQAAVLQEQVEALEGKIADREKADRERALAVKNHQLKFFDRRKLLRWLAQIHKKLQQGDLSATDRAELERKRAAKETDLKYVLYFPKDFKYVPLVKGKEGPPEARETYRKCLALALGQGEASGWAEL
ncbi:unnamed protein product, partial [Discosporangium mesarthrocarpum]